MTESKPQLPPEGGEPLLSDYDRVRTSVAAVLESEVSLDGMPRSQCYDGETAREQGIVKWVGFREGGPAGPLWVVQEEVLANEAEVYYITRFIGWTMHGLWRVNLGGETFGALSINRFGVVVMRDPDRSDLTDLTKRLPQRFSEAQGSGLVDYPLRSVKIMHSDSLLGPPGPVLPAARHMGPGEYSRAYR